MKGATQFVSVGSHDEVSDLTADSIRDDSDRASSPLYNDPLAQVRAKDLRKHIPQNIDRDIIDRNVFLV